MALIHCDFFSETLGLSTSMAVILPQYTEAMVAATGLEPRDRHPVLYLLHGLSDDHTAWTRQTSIERYAAGRGLAVVMPSVHRSFYTDMERGYPYWTFVSEELPRVARAFFSLSDRREDTFVAGLSMGGYGAFKLALRHPERFAAAASLSGVLDVAYRALRTDVIRQEELENLWGNLEGLAGTDLDLLHLAGEVGRREGPKPRLYQCCGTLDDLYEDNLRFREAAEEAGLDLVYEEHPAAHEWAYWDQQIQRVLEWLPLARA